MLTSTLTWLCAFLLAAGLATAQILLGGWMYPALAGPAFFLVALAAVMAGLTFYRLKDEPGAWCVGITLLMAGYLFWRQSTSPDAYAAREDAWLLLAALAVYLTAAWQLRGSGPRWLVLGAIFVLLAAQLFLLVVQFAAEAPFHPLPDLVLAMELPRGEAGPNRGWLSGTLNSRGTLSAVLMVGTFLVMGQLVWGRAGVAVKMVLLWLAAAGCAGVALSLSRAAYLGLATGLLVFALVSFLAVRRGNGTHRLVFSGAVLLVIMLPAGAALLLGVESWLVGFRFGEIGADTYREALWFRSVPPMLQLDAWWGAGANMFDQLSLRYREGAPLGRPVHAHNDWLQLLVEYGRVGLALGVLFFLVHWAAGCRNVLRLARQALPGGWWPQSMELGLATGALAAWSAQAVHSFFDFRLHLPAVALLVALCGGWLAGERNDRETRPGIPLPWWLRMLGVLPLIPGVVLLWWVSTSWKADSSALAAENMLLRGDAAGAWEVVSAARVTHPSHAELAAVAGQTARALAGEAGDGSWARERSEAWRQFVARRPQHPVGLREYALALTQEGHFGAARPWHLRAIARAPENGSGYEALAYHLGRQGRYEEAGRLYRLGRTLPGSSVSREELAAFEEFLRQRGR